MKKHTWILLLSSFSTITMAGTGLNCSDLDTIGQDDNMMEACIKNRFLYFFYIFFK